MKPLARSRRKPRIRSSGIYRSLKDGDLANPLSLPEFFESLGELIVLPPRLEDLAVEPPRETKKKPARPTRYWIPMLATGMAVALVAFASGRAPRAATLPPALAGHWVTAHENYQGRSLVITGQAVQFRNGADSGAWTTHLVTRVRSVQAGDTTRFTLTYMEGEGAYELAFKFASVPEPGIRFTNQQDLVWRPAPRTPGQVVSR